MLLFPHQNIDLTLCNLSNLRQQNLRSLYGGWYQIFWSHNLSKGWQTSWSIYSNVKIWCFGAFKASTQWRLKMEAANLLDGLMSLWPNRSMPAYILRRSDISKNGVKQMCKISGIRPDNKATWIWKFLILEDFWWASAFKWSCLYSFHFMPNSVQTSEVRGK